MPSTYTTIATSTLGSPASIVNFTSISGSYTDLRIIAVYRGTSTGINCYPNSDFTSNKSWTALRGSGSIAESSRNSSIAIQDYWTTVTNATGEFTVSKLDFMNYSNTTTFKTVLVRRDVSSAYTEALVNLYRSTSALTSLGLYSANGNFDTGSTFTLYGIKAA
jgi:hypothetical protein